MKKILSLALVLALATPAVQIQAQSNNKSFEEFRKGLLDDFQSFRSRILEHYSDFLNGEWHEYEPLMPEKRYSEPKPDVAPSVEPVKETPRKPKPKPKPTAANISVNDIFYRTTVENLYVIPSGPIPPNPSELLGSKKMAHLIEALAKAFDIVIYDAPPVLSVTDAQILSTKVDGTVLVVREKKVEKEAVRQAVHLLKHVNGRIIGTIVNDVHGDAEGYYGYYGKRD